MDAKCKKENKGSIEEKEGKEQRPSEKKKIHVEIYRFSGQLYNAEDQLLESDCKKLKKLCLNLIEKAQKIQIKFSFYKPTLIISFKLEDFDESLVSNPYTPLLIHFKELIRKNREMKVFADPEIFIRSFKRLYPEVPNEYFSIAQFGIGEAIEKNLKKMAKGNIKKTPQNFYLFFGCIKMPQKINFVLMDKDAFYVNFSDFQIQQKKSKYPAEYRTFLDFKNCVFKKSKEPETIEAEEEAVSENSDASSEELSELHKKTHSMIDQKLSKIMEFDLSNFKKQMELKNDELQALSKKGVIYESIEAQNLAQQVSDLHTNIENFENTKKRVEKLLRFKLETTSLETKLIVDKMCLKKMILAKKQLESKLPIFKKKQEIFEMLSKDNLFILEGETGSGKSTQLPQILCQFYNIFEQPKALPVLISQPRKLATRSLAERVAAQLGEKVGDFVDYQASSSNRKINPDAKIIFKLDRLILDELTVDPLLSKYCCLIIDEAHERTISIDVILGRVKSLLERRKDFKVIVTSASLDTKLFRQYFGKKLLQVEGRMYPVKQIFCPLPHINDTRTKIEKLITQTILEKDLSKVKDEYHGNILVFCSGVDEITDLVKMFTAKLSPDVFKILSLHGRMTAEQQREVFHESNKIKIIFASRIAETSITINGVKVVIDPGLDRQMVFDQKNKITSMQLKEISQSSAKQRAGRAGRTNSGICFRLYSDESKKKMVENKTPEIQNMALDSLVLRLKSLQIKNVLTFPYLSRPDTEGLKTSLQTMKIIGCLNSYEEITQIGKLLIKIPIEPFLSRAIIESYFYDFVLKKTKILAQLKIKEEEKEKLASTDFIESVIRVLAMLINSSSLYFIRFDERENAEKVKFQEYTEFDGDFYLFLNIFNQFYNLYSERKSDELKVWANKKYLSLKALHQARQIYSEIKSVLQNFKLNEKCFDSELLHVQNSLKSMEKADDVLLACLASSFVTNICLYSNNTKLGYTLMAQQTPIQLYGTTILSLQGIYPKWILSYDLYTNQNSQSYCKVAQKIDFDFLKKVVRKQILSAYRILEAEKKNPFYQNMVIELPSLIFMNILNDYRRRNNDPELAFLNRFTFFFFEELNTLEIYYLIKEFNEVSMNSGLKDYRQSNNAKSIIKGYIEEINLKYEQQLKYDYIGNLTIILGSGFDVKKINLKKNKFLFKVFATGQIAEITKSFCSQLGKCQQYSNKLVFEIDDQIKRNEFKLRMGELQKFASRIMRKPKESKNSLKCIEEIIDSRKKIPKVKLILTFYAGEAKKQNHVFLNYSKHEQPEKQEAYLVEMINFLARLRKFYPQFNFITLRMSKNNSGINCYFFNQLDEYEVNNILSKQIQNRHLGYRFEMPKSIIKFREPDFTQSGYTDNEWEKKIRMLLQDLGAGEEFAINIRGTYKRPKGEEPESMFEKTLRVNMQAEIEGFNLLILQKFKMKYDNRSKVLGTEKLHIKFEFCQTLACVFYDAFEALREDYMALTHLLKAKYPQTIIQESNPQKIRQTYKIFIQIKGEKREEFLEPSRLINRLFRPKLMKIPPKHSYRFDRFSRSCEERLIDTIEMEYNSKVYFKFDKKNYTLKIYCSDNIEEQIRKRITKSLSETEIVSQSISYRGQSLVKILKGLEQLQQKLKAEGNSKSEEEKGSVLSYGINYQRRQINVIADPDTLVLVKNVTSTVSKELNNQCSLCYEDQQKSYRLLHCRHSFCFLCLYQTIMEESTSTKCPECQASISIYDIRRIVSEEDFQKLCDRQIAKFVASDQRYHSCFSDCQQIFLTAQSQADGSFECQLCGKWYCFKCKESHKGWRCQQKEMKMLEKLGVKQCPHCKTGVQKNLGCNHMKCQNCKKHFCWVCLAGFGDEKSCYDHLTKNHGGVFFANMMIEHVEPEEEMPRPINVQEAPIPEIARVEIVQQEQERPFLLLGERFIRRTVTQMVLEELDFL